MNGIRNSLFTYLITIFSSVFLSMFLTCSGEENDLLDAPNGIATYNILDIGPAGGFIFYDKGYYSDGWRYLEVAPSDQSASAEWGCKGSLLIGADGTAIGTGKQNTIDIENGCTTVGTAADICANLVLGSYSDWFLPSIDELDLVYKAGVGGFAANLYWSSSEYDDTWAYYFKHSYSYKYLNDKDAKYSVRAVRAF